MATVTSASEAMRACAEALAPVRALIEKASGELAKERARFEDAGFTGNAKLLEEAQSNLGHALKQLDVASDDLSEMASSIESLAGASCLDEALGLVDVEVEAEELGIYGRVVGYIVDSMFAFDEAVRYRKRLKKSPAASAINEASLKLQTTEGLFGKAHAELAALKAEMKGMAAR